MGEGGVAVGTQREICRVGIVRRGTTRTISVCHLLILRDGGMAQALLELELLYDERFLDNEVKTKR